MVFNRLLDIVLANINFVNMLALVGAAFYVATLMVRTIVPLRIIGIISIVFFIAYGALAGAVATFLLYLLSLPINVIRLRQMLALVKKARVSAQGDLSMDWLRPFMTPRKYKKGDVLFQKGDVAKEMFFTVSGKFLVKEIGVELPPGRVMGELGFIDPNNRRTGTVESLEDGEVLTITYDRLLELYFQNPEFGYYLLRLTAERLMQNIARLETTLSENKTKLLAFETPAKAATELGSGGSANLDLQAFAGHDRAGPRRLGGGLIASMNASSCSGSWWNRHSRSAPHASASLIPCCQLEWPQPTCERQFLVGVGGVEDDDGCILGQRQQRRIDRPIAELDVGHIGDGLSAVFDPVADRAAGMIECGGSQGHARAGIDRRRRHGSRGIRARRATHRPAAGRTESSSACAPPSRRRRRAAGCRPRRGRSDPRRTMARRTAGRPRDRCGRGLGKCRSRCR